MFRDDSNTGGLINASATLKAGHTPTKLVHAPLPADAMLAPAIAGTMNAAAASTITINQRSDRWGNVEWMGDARNENS